jgi:thiol-disulfide isomerase/thioredoxin
MKSELKTAAIFGIVIVGIIASLSIIFASLENSNSSSDVLQEKNISISDIDLKIDKSQFKMAPDLVGIAHYINTTPEQLAKDIEGKVVLYDIWTYSCINCVRTLPYITAWNEKYADDGLLVIGIHSPEFEFEKDPYNVEMAVDKNGITYPVVLDNDMDTWKAFENRYWPRKYIADHEGFIRYDHIGEGKYDETEKVIQNLLEERATLLGLNVAVAEPLVEIEEFEHTSYRTPELYFGYKFASGRNQLGNTEGFNPEKDVMYTLPDDLKLHHFYLEGIWKNLQGSTQLVSDEGRIQLPYFAKEVNIVTAGKGDLTILLDGNPISSEYAGMDISEGKIEVEEPGLYNIVTSDKAASHMLEIQVSNPGFEIYTFTFG